MNVDSATVHSIPHSASTEVGSLRKGTALFVSSVYLGSGREWCRIKESADGRTLGWVLCSDLDRPLEKAEANARSSSAVSPTGQTIGPPKTPAEGEEATVIVDSATVHRTPHSASKESEKLSKGTAVFIGSVYLGSGRQWCRIKESAEGRVLGWVVCSDLDRPGKAGQVTGQTIGPPVADNYIATLVGRGPRDVDDSRASKAEEGLQQARERLFEELDEVQGNPLALMSRVWSLEAGIEGVMRLSELALRERFRANLHRQGREPSEGDLTGIIAAFRESWSSDELNSQAMSRLERILVEMPLLPIGDGGPALLAQLQQPAGMAISSQGDLYIAEWDGNRIRRVRPDGIIHTIAGTGIPGYSGDGKLAVTARIAEPFDVAVSNGDVYIADTGNHKIRVVTSKGKIRTLAGDGHHGFGGDGGPAIRARLAWPLGVAIDQAGNVYIADSGNNRIRKVDRSQIITTVAGVETPGYSGDGGRATRAQLSFPSDLTFDSQGNLYFVDERNQCVRVITTDGRISTVFGAGRNRGGGVPARPELVQLQRPTGIELDGEDNLFLVDSSQSAGVAHQPPMRADRVLRVTPGGKIDIIVGRKEGYSGDGGLARFAGLDSPQRLVIDSAGDLLISTGSDRIRKVGGVAVAH